jgi:hypothetical protein
MFKAAPATEAAARGEMIALRIDFPPPRVYKVNQLFSAIRQWDWAGLKPQARQDQEN